MSWFWDNFGGVITTVLAIYGAVLSSLNFWHTRKRDKKELYIKAIFHYSGYEEQSYVQIFIANKSLRPITVKEIGLKYTYLSSFKLLKPTEIQIKVKPLKCPKKLDTSEEIAFKVAFQYFDNHLKNANRSQMLKAVPYVIDTEGQRYIGSPFRQPTSFVLSASTDTDTDNKWVFQQG